MLKKQFFPIFLAVLLVVLLVGQVFFISNTVVHAQASTPISFDNMTQLSPNEQQVVYVTAQDVGMQGSTIWLANADLSQPVALVTGDSTSNSYWVTNPIWSPDGQQIAYVKVIPTNTISEFVTYRHEIWAIAMNGSNNRLLVDTAFHPSVGYGGQVSLLWNASNQIEFFDLTTFPTTKYGVNATTGTISVIGGVGIMSNPPASASISDVTQYLQETDPWAGEYINKDSTHCATIGEKGSAIVSSAMILNYLFPAPVDPINPSNVNNALHTYYNEPNIIGFKNHCYIVWNSLSLPYTTLSVDTNTAGPAPLVNETTWRQQTLLPKVQAQIASGIPVIVWYYIDTDRTEYARKNFVTVIGYNGNNLDVYDPKTNDVTTLDMLALGTNSIQGMIGFTGGAFFTKSSPAKGATDVDPTSVTLSWEQQQKTAPDSYRYCVHTSAQTSCSDPNNLDWISVGQAMSVTLQLNGDTEYNWQVQSLTGTVAPRVKLNANFLKGWTFKTLSMPVSIYGNVGIANARLDYDGGFTTADASGNYTIELQAGWSGRVTPSKANVIFDPEYIEYDNLQSDVSDENYTALLKISGNAGIGGVTISYTDGTPKTVTTNASGNYTIPNLPVNWSGTVTPSKSGFSFSPTYHWYPGLQASALNQNFTARVQISGNIGTTDVTGASVTYTINPAATAYTAPLDANGYYAFNVPYQSTGTVTPAKACYTFSPLSRTYSATAAQILPNFTLSFNTYSISGNVGPAGVIMTYTDGTVKTVTSDASGNYTIPNLPCGWTGSITPSKSGFTFSPAYYSYSGSGLQANSNKNFTALVQISGNIGTTDVAGASLTYTINPATTTTTPLDVNGNYAFNVPYQSTGTVTPAKACYTFSPLSQTYSATASQILPNFTLSLKTYSISGNVGPAGVIMTYTDGTVKTVTSDAGGNYTIPNLPCGWTGSITPSKSGFTFSPAYYSYSGSGLQANSNKNFTALVQISGNIGTTNVAGASLTYTINPATTTYTVPLDVNGNYAFNVPYQSTGTVTPAKACYTFSPINQTYSASASQILPNFTPNINMYSISGNVGTAGVTMSYTDGTPKTVITDASGGYTIPNLPCGWTGSVTPSKAGFMFYPASVNHTNLQANKSGQNFLTQIQITGNIGISGVAGATVVYTLDLLEIANLVYPDPQGNYAITVSTDHNVTVLVSADGYVFSPASYSYVDLAESQVLNFTAMPTISGNVGAVGATLSYTENGVAKTAVSDSSGAYSFGISPHWSGTVSISKPGVTFNPTSRIYDDVTTPQNNQHYPALVTFTSSAAYDGWVLESSQTSSQGGTIDSTANVFRLGDDASNRQYRSILSFPTGSLPDAAVVQTAVLKIKQNGASVGDNPFTTMGSLRADIREGTFGTSALQITDFEATASALAVATFGDTPASNWYSANINATGRGLINAVSGATQFRLRFSTTYTNNGTADYMKFLSGDFTSDQPTLTITYLLQ